MWSRHLTLIVLSPRRGKVREIKVRKLWLALAAVVTVLFPMIGAVGIHQYFSAKGIRGEMKRLLHENRSQQDQIRSIATEMDTLREKLVSLQQFDTKIRIMANLERSPVETAFSGMGGVSPEVGILQSLQPEKREKWVGQIREQVASLGKMMEQQQESFEALEGRLREKQDLLACTPSIWPTQGWLASGFGYRQSPFTGLREFHRGLDIATQKGTPVIATADGVVVKTGKDRGFGNYVSVDHGFGYQTYYAHLQEVVVKKGQRVRRGQMLGKVGNTGRSTGPHLHYEVRLNGLAVNPIRHILN